MGRLIDIDEARKEYSNLIDLTMSDTTLLHTLYGVLDNAPTVEAVPKADYEARLKKNNELVNGLEELRTMINKFAESYETRLKADMVGILTEIQLEIEELEPLASDSVGFDMCVLMSSDIIQQKINLLKEAD